MRFSAVFLLLFLCFAGLSAMEADEAINMMNAQGFVQSTSSGVYFLANSVLQDVMVEPDDAVLFVARMSFMLLMIQDNWIEYTPNSVTSSWKQVEKVGCSYFDGTDEQLLYVSIS